MSILKNDVKHKNGLYKQRFLELAKLGIKVFHSSDLASLWQIKNPNTLRVTLKRYADEGLIIRIQKGLYSILPIEKIDPLILGMKILHRYAYVSTETVLARAGIIFQKIPQITIVSSVSKKFSVGNNSYYCRQLADRFLFNDAGIVIKAGIQIATAERAIADILYFNPNYHFDAGNQIDWQKVRFVQKQIGYPIVFSKIL